MNKNSLWRDVRWGQPYVLPTALPRACRNASTVLRLPRRLYPLKHDLLDRITNFSCSGRNVLIYYLRSIRRQT